MYTSKFDRVSLSALVALALLPMHASATNPLTENNSFTTISAAQANPVVNANPTATANPTTGVDIDFRDQLQIPPTPPAIPSNLYNAVICPVISQGTSAWSTPLFSRSKSDASTVYVNGICVCFHLSDPKKRDACMHNYAMEADKVYKKIHSQ